MSARIIPFPSSPRQRGGYQIGNCCQRCGAILESDWPHTKQVCDASLEDLASLLRANGWTENDEELPAHLRGLLRGGAL